jgi:hypothetical protein
MSGRRLPGWLPIAAAAGLALALLAAADAALALTKIEGQYQLMMDLRKSGRVFPWDWNSNSDENWTPAELRIFSQPRPGIESFVKAEADWNSGSNNAARPVFQFREAHLRFRRERGKRGTDTYVFSKQDRFPTWDQYLIKFINGYGGGQGVRFDTWGYGGFNTWFLVGDYSDQYNAFITDPDSSVRADAPLHTDDIYVARIRRDFFKDQRLRMGFTWSRRENNQAAGDKNHNEIFGLAGRYKWLGQDFMLEYGVSQGTDPTVRFPEELHREITVFRAPTGIGFPDRHVLQAEIKTLQVSIPVVGSFNCIPTYWTRGAKWQNGQGEPGRDETGFNLHSYYRLPERAITYTNNLLSYSSYATNHSRVTENYNELYIEFVNGFTGKTYYRQRGDYREVMGLMVREAHNDWFGEVTVESKLAWLRVQAKVKDVGRPEHKQLYAVENTVNLTLTLKVYNRFAFGNDASILRKAVFTQLQYRPTGNVEMYLQYGPDWIGNSQTPVDEGNLQGSGDQTDLVKFILKGYF